MTRINKNKRFIRDPRYRLKMAKGYENNVFLIDWKTGILTKPYKLQLGNLQIGDNVVITDDPSMSIRIRVTGRNVEGELTFDSYVTYQAQGGKR